MRSRPFIALTVASVIACVALVVPSQRVSSATGLEGFDANYLIADSLMYGGVAAASMDATEIQNFLDSHAPSCVEGSDGSPCLKNATFDSMEMPASQWCPGRLAPSTGEKASSLIARVARACEVSPKVLLVLLQKEQGLITTSDPTVKKYSRATGYRCPDGAACETQHAGFVSQIYGAASRYQEYRKNPGAFTYRVGQKVNIAYSTNETCGAKSVTIATAATAALYNYTPYTPNDAALNAVTGEGDKCSTYGNRNFFRSYSLWFGRPNPPDSVSNTTAPSSPNSDSSTAVRGPLTQAATSPEQDLTGDGIGDALQISDGEVKVVDYAAAVSGNTVQVTDSGRVGWGWPLDRSYGIGDWDADGFSDLAIVDSKGRLLLYSGRTKGWAAPRAIGVGWSGYDLVRNAYDWDGDSRPDIIARGSTGRLFLYPSNGRGGFRSRILIGHGWGSLSKLTVIPTWQAGHPAIAAVASDGRLRIYTSNGRGSFSGRIDFGLGWSTMRSLGGIDDIDGNGRGELVAVDSAGRIVVYRPTGSSFTKTHLEGTVGFATILAGGMTGRTDYAITATGELRALVFHYGARRVRVINTGIPIALGERAIVAGSWDDDDRGDIIRWATDGRLFLHRGLAAGAFGPGKEIGYGWNFTDVVPVENWNGSGRSSLLAWDRRSGSLRLYPSRAGGGFAAPLVVGNDLTWADAIVDGGNWSGAAGPQLLARRASDGSLWRIGTRNGWLDVAGAVRVGVGWSGLEIHSPGDLTGDDRVDIVTESAGRVKVYPSAGSDRFAAVIELLS